MKRIKNLSKRGLALLISLMMCLSMLPVTALAAEGSGTESDPYIVAIKEGGDVTEALNVTEIPGKSGSWYYKTTGERKNHTTQIPSGKTPENWVSVKGEKWEKADSSGKLIVTDYDYIYPILTPTDGLTTQVNTQNSADNAVWVKFEVRNKENSTITLKQETQKVTIKNLSANNYDDLRKAIFGALVEEIKPATLIWDQVTIQYKTGTTLAPDVDKKWHSLTGESGTIFSYPAIGYGSHEIRISWDGNDAYNGTSAEGTIDLRSGEPVSADFTNTSNVMMVRQRDLESVDWNAAESEILNRVTFTDENGNEVAADQLDNVRVQYLGVQLDSGTENILENLKSLVSEPWKDLKDGFGTLSVSEPHYAVRVVWDAKGDYASGMSCPDLDITKNAKEFGDYLISHVIHFTDRDDSTIALKAENHTEGQSAQYTVEWDKYNTEREAAIFAAVVDADGAVPKGLTAEDVTITCDPVPATRTTVKATISYGGDTEHKPSEEKTVTVWFEAEKPSPEITLTASATFDAKDYFDDEGKVKADELKTALEAEIKTTVPEGDLIYQGVIAALNAAGLNPVEGINLEKLLGNQEALEKVLELIKSLGGLGQATNALADTPSLGDITNGLGDLDLTQIKGVLEELSKLVDTQKITDALKTSSKLVTIYPGTPAHKAGVYGVAVAVNDERYEFQSQYENFPVAVGYTVIKLRPVDVKVLNAKIKAGEDLPGDFVTTTPTDAVVFKLFSSVTAGANTGLWLDLPEGQIEPEAATVGELRTWLKKNSDTALDALNIDSAVLSQLLGSVLDAGGKLGEALKLGELTDSTAVYYGAPTKAGMYTAAAIAVKTGECDIHEMTYPYGLGVGFGSLVVGLTDGPTVTVQKDAECYTDQQIPTTLVTRTPDEAKVVTMYAGVTSNVTTGIWLDVPGVSSLSAKNLGELKELLRTKPDRVTEILKDLGQRVEKVCRMADFFSFIW